MLGWDILPCAHSIEISHFQRQSFAETKIDERKNSKCKHECIKQIDLEIAR